jgi:hypothetical protein
LFSGIVEASHHYWDTSAPNCLGIGRILDADCVGLQHAINSGRACYQTSTVAEPTAELPCRLIGEVELNGGMKLTSIKKLLPKRPASVNTPILKFICETIGGNRRDAMLRVSCRKYPEFPLPKSYWPKDQPHTIIR